MNKENLKWCLVMKSPRGMEMKNLCTSEVKDIH